MLLTSNKTRILDGWLYCNRYRIVDLKKPYKNLIHDRVSNRSTASVVSDMDSAFFGRKDLRVKINENTAMSMYRHSHGTNKSFSFYKINKKYPTLFTSNCIHSITDDMLMSIYGFFKKELDLLVTSLRIDTIITDIPAINAVRNSVLLKTNRLSCKDVVNCDIIKLLDKNDLHLRHLTDFNIIRNDLNFVLDMIGGVKNAVFLTLTNNKYCTFISRQLSKFYKIKVLPLTIFHIYEFNK